MEHLLNLALFASSTNGPGTSSSAFFIFSDFPNSHTDTHLINKSTRPISVITIDVCNLRSIVPMSPMNNSWQFTKIGGGPSPIETSEGWLLIYHGVLNSCNGFVYSAGVALLDIDQPWKVIGRAKPYILNPREYYECVGDVPNVVFPCAALCDADTGRLAIYYGAADTVVALAFSTVDDLVQLIKSNPW